MKETENLITEVGNLCMNKAKEILESDQISLSAKQTEAALAAETVRALIQCADILDGINLRWARQNRSCAAAYPARFLARPKEGN